MTKKTICCFKAQWNAMRACDDENEINKLNFKNFVDGDDIWDVKKTSTNKLPTKWNVAKNNGIL